MKYVKTLVIFIQKTSDTLISVYFLVLIMILFIVISGCNKTSEPTPDSKTSSSSSSNIVYKSYIVDSLNLSNDTIYYDVNNDNINDIMVTRHLNVNGSTIDYSGIIRGINNNIYFCYIKTQPTWTMLTLDDDINYNNSLNWNFNCIYSGNRPYFSSSNYWTLNAFTNYFGFIINLNSKDYYGWFHFKYQSISESGMNLLSNATIKVGQKI